MTEFRLTPGDIEPPDKPRPKGHIPYLPDRTASFSVLRQWVSHAIGLPDTVRVDAVQRFGRDDDDALSITLSNDLVIRCNHQRKLHSPGTFSAFFASESDGLCRPKYLSRAEVADVFTALCALATISEARDELSELRERLEQFVSLTSVVHASLTPLYRYSTLRKLQARESYDRTAATANKQGRAAVAPVIVADHEWKGYFIRANEFVTYLRIVHLQTLGDTFLKGRMAELGCTYHTLQAHGPGRRGHASITFYELAEDMSVPHHEDSDHE